VPLIVPVEPQGQATRKRSRLKYPSEWPDAAGLASVAEYAPPASPVADNVPDVLTVRMPLITRLRLPVAVGPGRGIRHRNREVERSSCRGTS